VLCENVPEVLQNVPQDVPLCRHAPPVEHRRAANCPPSSATESRASIPREDFVSSRLKARLSRKRTA
jgi:hypothetical protein